MYIVPIAWLYVALMMAVAEAKAHGFNESRDPVQPMTPSVAARG